jgi:hypothetical protein
MHNGYGYNAVRLAASLVAMPAMRLAGAGWREREPTACVAELLRRRRLAKAASAFLSAAVSFIKSREFCVNRQLQHCFIADVVARFFYY